MSNFKFWMVKEYLKAWWQRLWRIDGIADMDMWNVDHYLSTKIAPTLKRFIKIERHGVPSVILDEPEHDDADYYVPIWEAILYKMLDGFERIESGMCDEIGRTEKYTEEALELFCEFYFNLWN